MQKIKLPYNYLKENQMADYKLEKFTLLLAVYKVKRPNSLVIFLRKFIKENMKFCIITYLLLDEGYWYLSAFSRFEKKYEKLQ